MHKPHRIRRVALVVGTATLAACVDQSPTAVGEPDAQPGRQIVQDDVAGISLAVPTEWKVIRDAVQFSNYGFVLYDHGGDQTGGYERSPVARVALAYRAKPGDIEALVQKLRQENPGRTLARSEVEVGNGRKGIAISGLPGTDPYTEVFVADGDRVYQIGMWSMTPGLDARAKMLLGSLRFDQPKRSVQSLRMRAVEQAAYASPPPEVLAASRAANAERIRQVALHGGEPLLTTVPVPERPALSASSGTQCESGQPSTLLWQTNWDATNRFYSGYTTKYSSTYYNLRPNDPGWSAMSGNYGSWWGWGPPNYYHYRKCDPNYLNQHYANDWPMHQNANSYSSTTGTVTFAGWTNNGYWSLGYHVVVKNGNYRALMAHHASLAVRVGETVGMNTIIGYAGNTGSSANTGYWDEHVHSRIGYGESTNSYGQPWGGHTVWPERIRCVSCRATDPGATDGYGDGQYDLMDASGAKYYVGSRSRGGYGFYHGRWMRG